MFKRTTAINKIKALKKRIKVIQGGTSAGKTFAILPILIDRATKKPNLEISVVSESIPHLKRGALKDFLKIMKLTNRYIDEHYNRTDRKYTFSNGSYIEFFSPESILGARRDILFINECNNISFNDYFQLAIRTSGEIFLDYNPTNEFWCHTEIIPDADADFIILTYKDNEALGEVIVNELEKAKVKAETDSYWANWWKVYGLGQVGTLEGVIFGDFKSIDVFPNDCEWVAYGLDFGYTNDPTALIKVGKKADTIYLQQLIYQTGLTNDDINQLMKGFNIGKAEIIADSSEPKSIEQLRRLGWNVKGAVKGADSILNGIHLMKQYSFAIVSDSLDLIKEWRGYSWKIDKSSDKALNVPIDFLNHAIDAVRYLISYKLIMKRTAPRSTVITYK